MDHLPSLAGLPDWMHDRIRTADRLFMQARAAALEGNHATADRLRNEADLIYNELEAALQAPAIAGEHANSHKEVRQNDSKV